MFKLNGQENKDFLKILGNCIKYYRESKKLTTKALAYTIGVELSTVCRWENGTYKLSGDNIIKLIIHIDFDVRLIYAVYESMPKVLNTLSKDVTPAAVCKSTKLNIQQAEKLLAILAFVKEK